jgi:hypothetical protein
MNCGAELTGATCELCGMSVAAAELALRRKLLNRTAIFLLGAIAFIFATGRFPPLESDGILIFVGVLFFLTLGLAMLVERRAMRHKEVEALKRVYYGLIPVPWVLGVVLIVNGAFDHGPRVDWHARVISRFAMFGPLPSRRLVVESWREGHRFERVPVSREDYDRFHPGDDVIVRVGDGFALIPWVAGVDRE